MKKENGNGTASATVQAAHYKTEYILSFFLSHLSARKAVWLLIGMSRTKQLAKRMIGLLLKNKFAVLVATLSASALFY